MSSHVHDQDRVQNYGYDRIQNGLEKEKGGHGLVCVRVHGHDWDLGVRDAKGVDGRGRGHGREPCAASSSSAHDAGA